MNEDVWRGVILGMIVMGLGVIGLAFVSGPNYEAEREFSDKLVELSTENLKLAHLVAYNSSERFKCQQKQSEIFVPEKDVKR